ncbi:MAG: heavy metal translocating P-type ATPase [Robiginitomaculum sp.]|nr:MAG: heavy metal translocating P-type ATPase [Robiginitomaculum sp.]
MVEINNIDLNCPSGQSTAQDIARNEANHDHDETQFSPYVQTKANGDQVIDLMISGAHCSGCMAKIERELATLPDIRIARMNLSTMRLNVAWRGEQTNASSIVAKLDDIGFGAKPFDMQMEPLHGKNELKSLLRAMAVAGVAMANIMVISVCVWAGIDMGENTRQLMHILSGFIALPAVAYAGQPFFRSAWRALKNKQTNMDVPISLAVLLACALSIYETYHGNPDTYFDAATMLLFLLLIGRYLDQRLRLKTGESAQRLAAMQASNASLVTKDGALTTVPASMIKPDDILLIAAGERIPVDGEIIKGRSTIDTSIANGETLPAPFGVGDMIYSGMINLGNPLTIKATAVSSDSFLSEISKLVEAGEQTKSKFVRIADRAARAYVPIVHSLAVMTFIGWLAAGGSLRTATLNAIAVLIITCPCALGLAVPAVQIVASGRLFRKGVLIKSGDALERLAKIDTIIFDKTGTVTLGRLALINADILGKDILELAAKLARGSRHPIARAIADASGQGNVTDTLEDIMGEGLRAKIDGKIIKLGSADFVGAKASSEDTQVETWLRVGRAKPIRFVFKDVPRLDARETIEKLQGFGYQLELLSGDTENMTAQTADALGLKNWTGGVSPQDKLAHLESLKANGRFPLMVGDGINDAPALASATASASPASAADISRAAADIILQGDKLSGLVTALRTAKDAQKRVIENLSLAVLYNMIAVPLAIFGFVNPMIAALAMSGSSMLVTLNALRLARH